VHSSSSVGRLARRTVVALTRVGVGVRGARELSVRGKDPRVSLRVLVFPVTVDGVEYLVSTRPNVPWVKRLLTMRCAELRLGRTRREVQVPVVVDADDAARILRAYQQRVPSLLSRETDSGSRPVVFRLDPK
jgi:hypothetical protein